MAVLHPESFLLIVFMAEDTLYDNMDIGGFQVGHEAGGVPRGGGGVPRVVGIAPPLVEGGWSLSGAFFAQYF